jgi:dephospho-CoA kinase
MQTENKAIKIIGVTGGIGCGMSTVSQMMKEQGARIVNGDKVARDIVEKGQPALDALAKAFSKEILQSDGSLDRKKLGDIVFASHDKLNLLNNTVRPFWVERLKSEIEHTKQNSNGSVVIVDAAILLEAGLRDIVDKLIVVTAPIKVRRERIRARDFLDECQIDQRIAAQIPVSEKAKQADFVIENTGTIEQTKQKIDQIWNELIPPTNQDQ